MKSLVFSKAVLIGAAVTPVFLLVAMISAGVGHGSYLPMIIFYPIPLLLLVLGIAADGIQDAFLNMIVVNGVPALAIVIAIIQFPLYGFVISYSGAKKEPTWFAIWEIVVWIHIAISGLALPKVLISMVF